MRPGLSWSSRFDRSANLGDSAWIVHLMNFGPGPANIERISYALKIAGPSGDIEREELGHRDVVEFLKDFGLEEGHDYSLHFITPGAALPVVKQTSEGLEFAAFKPAVIERLSRLNFTVRVADIVGDHHEKSLPFIATLPAAWREAKALSQ